MWKEERLVRNQSIWEQQNLEMPILSFLFCLEPKNFAKIELSY